MRAVGETEFTCKEQHYVMYISKVSCYLYFSRREFAHPKEALPQTCMGLLILNTKGDGGYRNMVL